MKRVATALLLGLIACAAQAAPEDFPRPPGIEPAVRFWTQVYTGVSTDAGLLHDRENLDVVYEALHFDGRTRHQRVRYVRERKAHYRKLLQSIARKPRSEMTHEEREILKLWPDGVSNARLRRAAHDIRFQLGQSDKFRAGLVRSGAWEPHIRRTLESMGLPEEIAALPHVESSFNPDAWSRVGAAGLWQFTRSTGRRYMRIDHLIDERMDPFKSTIAAARLLEHNHSVTNNWALAITAYNHGLAGIRRAARQLGTDNIATIIERYSSRTWGFASRNFYAAFLAAVEVDFHAEKYFGLLERADAVVSETVELPFYAPADALVEALDVTRERLRELNRALRDPIWSGDKRVPRGYALRVPAGADRPPAEELIARISPEARYFAQIPDRFHRVRRGETLSAIASRYNVSPRTLVSLNNLRSQHFIRAGQSLRLPVPDDGPTADSKIYTVQRGDTLSGIARRVGMNVSSLVAANGLEDRDSIYPGQDLRVDGQSAQAVTVVATAETESGPETKAASASDTDSGTGTRTETDGPAQTGAGESTPEATAARTGTAAPAEAVEAAAPDARDTGEVAGGDSVPATGSTAETESADSAEREALADATADEAPIDDSYFATRRLVLGAVVPAVPDSDVIDQGLPGPDDGTTEAPVETAPALSADPADYSVRDDGTIEVQAAETLGHYAEWLDLRASELRRINDMRYGQPLVIGKRLELNFRRVEPARFQARREAYHEQIQARFFEQFRITGTLRETIGAGDSLWTIARRSDNVPVWLLRQYNPDLNFDDLHPGMPVTLPRLERQPTNGDGGSARAASADGDPDA